MHDLLTKIDRKQKIFTKCESLLKFVGLPTRKRIEKIR